MACGCYWEGSFCCRLGPRLDAASIEEALACLGRGGIDIPYLTASGVQLLGDAPGERIVVGGHGPEDQSLESPPGALPLVVFLVPTTLLFHGDVADRMERIQLFKNLAIMGGLLLVVDQNSRG
jgi:hypothetical protein